MTANEIYTILVVHAGARESARRDFVRYWSDRPEQATEWRFCGSLGFGGKVYRDGLGACGLVAAARMRRRGGALWWRG